MTDSPVNARPAAAPATMVPRPALAAAAVLVAGSLLAVFLLPHGPHEAGVPRGPAERQRLLRFSDRDDGAVVATDAATGAPVAVVTGEAGFLRATMSGLARIRITEGIGPVPPFRLTQYAANRLVLDDPATGKSVELEAFGPTNRAVFAAFLPR